MPGVRADLAVRCCPSAQVLRYTFPFMFIAAVFWLLHTWILDPLPNQFRRREFIRYRCAAGQVSNGTAVPCYQYFILS